LEEHQVPVVGTTAPVRTDCCRWRGDGAGRRAVRVKWFSVRQHAAASLLPRDMGAAITDSNWPRYSLHGTFHRQRREPNRPGTAGTGYQVVRSRSLVARGIRRMVQHLMAL